MEYYLHIRRCCKMHRIAAVGDMAGQFCKRPSGPAA